LANAQDTRHTAIKLAKERERERETKE